MQSFVSSYSAQCTNSYKSTAGRGSHRIIMQVRMGRSIETHPVEEIAPAGRDSNG